MVGTVHSISCTALNQKVVLPCEDMDYYPDMFRKAEASPSLIRFDCYYLGLPASRRIHHHWAASVGDRSINLLVYLYDEFVAEINIPIF
jgi:hypothetical protein